MKKYKYFAVLLLAVILISGCWSRKEIEDLAIVSALGIDRVEVADKLLYKISLLVVRPSQLGGQRVQATGEKNPEWLVTETGNSIFEALQHTSLRSPRSVKLYHNDLVLIGQKTARAGIQDTLDFMLRHKDIRLRTWIFVSRQEATEVLSGLPETEQLLSQEISEILTKSSPDVSEILPVDLRMFTEALITPGWEAVAPVVVPINPREPLGGPREKKEPSQVIALEGMAVFLEDKLVGFLSLLESKGFLYIIGKSRGGVIPVKVPGAGAEEVSFVMTRSSSKIKPVIRAGRLEIDVTIRTEADVGEVSGKLEVGDPKVIEKLDRVFSETVRKLTQKTLDKAQKQYKADIFGFGSQVHKEFPRYWREIEKEWYDMYPELPVNIKVEGQVRRTSVLANPVEIK